ncbi:S1 RNA-binding domain-containing protein, partial [Francisella tularensis]|uniref:S1 RNA-binding domain-containing protein n=1 Tax=Francisella tularensis TaxID=263 RepID=UPI002381ACF5
MISVGKYHKLVVLDKRINCLVLDALELGKAKLPVVEVDNIINIGDYVEVFLYHN